MRGAKDYWRTWIQVVDWEITMDKPMMKVKLEDITDAMEMMD